MSEEKRKDNRTEPLPDLNRAGMGIFYAPDPRVTTYSDRGQSSNYAENLFAGSASKRLGKKEYSSMKRSGSLSLALYLLTACLCAGMTAVSLYDLFLDLTTGKMMILITGYFPWTYYNLEPLFFVMTASFGLFLTLTLLWVAAGKSSKLRMIKRLAAKSA